MFGGDSEEVTPVPIPNTAVKLFSADGSWGFPPVRVGRRQAITFNCILFLKKDILNFIQETFIPSRGGAVR